MGLGIEFAEDEIEGTCVGDFGLIIVGELVEEYEKVFGIDGSGGAGGEDGVGLVVERQEGLDSFGGEIE